MSFIIILFPLRIEVFNIQSIPDNITLIRPKSCNKVWTDSNAAWLARIMNGDAIYVWAIITPSMDWVNSTPGKYCTKLDLDPYTPNRRAPLASGGRTSGIITTTLITNFLRKLVYLARKYARGIPKRARNRVDIDAELRLRTKAS